MKKIFFLLLFLSVYITGFAQKIETDRIEDDGRRQLMSSEHKEKLDGSEYQFIVKAYEKYGQIDWFLLIASFRYIPDNAVLLIKLGNGDTISKLVNNRIESEISLPTYTYIVGNIGVQSGPNKGMYYTALFDFSEEQFQMIEEYGIEKIRISSRSSYNEKTWKKDKLGKFIKKCREKISKKLRNTRVKSIYDDF